MPEFDGMAFLTEFHNKEKGYKQAPVIVLTNVTSGEIKAEVEKLNIAKFVVKTDITPTELIGIIEEVSK
jgi:response regulator RpfG family c-di-GMP phosphodiesterase